MGAVPRVAIIVVTYNSAKLVAECVRSLPAACHGLDWSLTVVDNASGDDSVGVVLSNQPHVSVVRLAHNGGYAAGVNAGVASTGTGVDAYLVLNPDVRLAPGSVAALWTGLCRSDAGMAVPRVSDGDGSLAFTLRRQPSVIRALGEGLLGGNRAGRHPRLGEVISDPQVYERDAWVDWATGAVVLVAARCMIEVGPWDESFFLYSEETDFALRARDHGFRTRYVAAAHAVHLGGESGTSPRLWSLLTTNRVALYRRRHGKAATAAFWSAVVVNELLRLWRSKVHREALSSLLLPRGSRRRSGAPPAQDSPGYVCFASVDWWYHNRAHADFQLMRQVALTRQVLVVNSIGMRMPMPGRSPQAARRMLRKARSMLMGVRRPIATVPGFHVMTPVIFPLYGSRRGRKINARLVRWQVGTVCRALRMPRPVIVVSLPTAAEVAREMPRSALVFNRSDKHSAFAEADRFYVAGLEDELLRTADTVLYASHRLMDEDQALVGDRGLFLDHGVDIEAFRARELPEPADLAVIPHPRLGFFGGFDDYIIDFSLLVQLAKELPFAHIVLIGDATCPMDGLTCLPNVHWLGFRPIEQIPSYGAGFDVALMPFLDNEWIRNSNPIKLKEYLALGLPIVSTHFDEVDHYRELVRIAGDSSEFVELVRASLRDGGPGDVATRIASVQNASWQTKAQALVASCEPPWRAG